MKRNSLLFIGLSLVLAMLIFGTAGCETLSPPSTTKSSTISGIFPSQQNTGIWVTGEGKISVVPDIAILSLGVEAQMPTVSEAQNEAAAAMDAVTRELYRHGIVQKDIKTQQFSIYPVRKYQEDEEITIGYRVTNTVTVKVRVVEDTGTIIDAVVKAGGDYIRINNISFTVDDPSLYYKDAREKAMADAETKAKQLANSGGVKLGEPVYISESGGFIYVSNEYTKSGMATVPAPTTPISPGETEISLTVQVVYSIK